MTSSAFDSCSDGCGWMAAFVAALTYGSFGVPIKATKDVDVHPLVFQSYKTFVMFVTCWGVKLLGVDIGFTNWGLLSGFLWVVGGTGGIYGIRNAGLAIAVGTWASIMVIVNFVFGILVFKEPVADIWGTLGAFLLLIVGLVGMSKYSAPQQHPKEDTPQEFYDAVQEDPPNDGGVVETAGFRNDGSYQSTSDAQQIRKRATEGDGQVVEFGTPFTLTADDGDRDDISPLSPDGITLANGDHNNDGPYILLFSGRLPLTKRQCGILGAAMNGVMTGGSLIPLHYAKDEGFGGARYFPSMACGALLSNALLWCIWFAHNAWSDHRHHGKTLRDTLMEMPKWEFRVLWMPAFLAGLLLSIAMFTSILAVTYLGQGVGNSLVQTKILVSGLWGIFWYHEIVGFTTIAKWFASAGVCIVAIIWLSMERLEATGGGGH